MRQRVCPQFGPGAVNPKAVFWKHPKGLLCPAESVKRIEKVGQTSKQKTNKGKDKQIKHRQKATRQSTKMENHGKHTHNGSGTRDVAIQVLVNCLNRACAPNTHQTPTHADTDMRQKLNILRPSMTLRPSNLLITSLQYSTPFFYYLRTDKCQSSS